MIIQIFVQNPERGLKEKIEEKVKGDIVSSVSCKYVY